MQRLRNALFYLSPLLGAVLGGVIGHSSETFLRVVQILIGLGVGCAVSCLMMVWSVRARFKEDGNFTENPLKNSKTPKSQ
jgi:hypothetical protein